MRIAFVYCHLEPLSSTRGVHVALAPSAARHPLAERRGALLPDQHRLPRERGERHLEPPLGVAAEARHGVEPSDELAVEAE